MITKKDVAKKAGVSSTTVSYYMNNSGYVSKEKKERIKKAIKELNYHPNLIAKSLRMKETKQLVLICDEIRNPYYTQLVYNMSIDAYKNDYTLLFCNVIDDPKYLDRLCSYQVDGVIIASGKICSQKINNFVDRGIPVVLASTVMWDNIHTDVTKINVDSYSGMRELTKHLIDKGHQNIAYLSSCSSTAGPKYDRKIKGYYDEMDENGIKVNEDNIFYNIVGEVNSSTIVKNHLKTASVTPTAYICENDSVGIGAIEGIKELGYQIPKDISVTGFDNSEISKLVTPTLTTINIDSKELSRKMIDIMIRKINNQSVNDEDIKTKLIIREST